MHPYNHPTYPSRLNCPIVSVSFCRKSRVDINWIAFAIFLVVLKHLARSFKLSSHIFLMHRGYHSDRNLRGSRNKSRHGMLGTFVQWHPERGQAVPMWEFCRAWMSATSQGAGTSRDAHCCTSQTRQAWEAEMSTIFSKFEAHRGSAYGGIISTTWTFFLRSCTASDILKLCSAALLALKLGTHGPGMIAMPADTRYRNVGRPVD